MRSSPIAGFARVDTLDGLIEGLPLLARMPRPGKEGGRRAAVGVITTTGGGATMVVDPLSVRGVAIEPPSAETLKRLAAAGIDVKPARIVDVTLAGTRYDVMKAALDILTTAPEYDLVLAVIGSSARFHPELAVKPIVDSAGAAKPIAACLVPDAPGRAGHAGRGRGAELPHARKLRRCDRRRAAAACAARLQGFVMAGLVPAIHASTQSTRQDVDARHKAGHDESRGRLLDEFDAGTLLERFGIPRAPAVALDAALTRAPALPFPYPVAVKALSAEIAHKTEAGGVVLGVADGGELMAAIRQIRANLAQQRTLTRLRRVLVQPMVVGVGEALLGYRLDPAAGPLVMVAAGGVFTEIYRDRSLRIAPVDLATAREMIAEVRGFALLKGFRGMPKGDLDALAQAIVALSKLADEPSIVEAEINPMIVQTDGVVAVDALVKLA